MKNYQKHSTPPEWAKKQIGGGRLKGMTDINPQWRIYALTDLFGSVGFGWRYEVVRLERVTQEGSPEIAVFSTVNLYVKQDGEWSAAIVGTGGSMFVSSEKGGVYTSDECEKMAITDALSVCCKQIGIGSDVYSGSKYVPAATPAAPTANNDDLKRIVLAAATMVERAADVRELIKLCPASLRADADVVRELKEVFEYLTKKEQSNESI